MKRKLQFDIFLINFLLFASPLVYLKSLGYYNTFKYFLFGTIVLILFGFTVYRFLKNKWLIKSFFKSWYSYGLIAYFASFVITSITSTNPALSFFSTFSRTDGAFTMIFLLLFSLSIYSVLALSPNKNKTIKQFLTFSVLSAFVLSLLVVFSSEGLNLLRWNWLTQSGGGATTGNQSIAGSYLIWNVFFAIILFIKSKTVKKKILPAICFIVIFFAPSFFNWNLLSRRETYSGLIDIIGLNRGAFLGIISGFFITLFVWLFLSKNTTKKYIGGFLIAITLLGSIGVGASILNKTSYLHQKFIDYTSESRFIFWDASIKAFKENPVLGLGPGTFSYSFHKFFNPSLLVNSTEVFVSRAHNIFFETLQGGGILLFSSLLFFLISLVWGFVVLAKRSKLSSLSSALLIGAITGWLIQAQFVFDSILSLLMLFLVSGILYGLLSDRDEKLKKKEIPFNSSDRFIIFIYCIFAVSLFVYAIALPFKKDRVMFEAINSKLPGRIDMWKNFSGISPMGDSFDTVWIFDNLFKTYYKERYKIETWDKNKKDMILRELEQVSEYLYKVSQNSKNYDVVLTASRIFYLRMYIARGLDEDSYNKMQELIDKAISLSETDPRIYWMKSQLEAADGDFVYAKELLEKAFSLEPEIPYTHALMLELAKNMKDKNYYNFILERSENMYGITREGLEDLKKEKEE